MNNNPDTNHPLIHFADVFVVPFLDHLGKVPQIFKQVFLRQINLIARTLNDDALFTSIIQSDKLPVGSSPAPHDQTNVWTWDNHGRYLVGIRWTADGLRIRRLDKLNVK